MLLDEGIKYFDQIDQYVKGVCKQYSFNKNFYVMIDILREEIYSYYPFLFAPAFVKNKFGSRVITKLQKLSFSGNCYYLHIILNDRLIDLPVEENRVETVLLSNHFQQKSIQILNSLFTETSHFWALFISYRSQFYEALLKEVRNHYGVFYPYEEEEYISIAKGKSSMAKAATAALAVLYDKEDILEPVSLSQDYYHIAMQLADDIKDWRKDYESRHYSYILSKVIESHQLGNEVNSNIRPAAELIGKMLYFSGAAEYGLNLATDYLNKALDVVNKISCDDWKKVIEYNRIKNETDILAIETTRKKELSKSRNLGINDETISQEIASQKENTLIVPKCQKDKFEISRSDILVSIQRGINFIFSNQEIDGKWIDFNDFPVNMFSCTEWVTGYIGRILIAIEKSGLQLQGDKSRLMLAGKWLASNEHMNGGWGYNHLWGVDADSTWNCLHFLYDLGIIKKSKINQLINVILDSQNNDGGIGTYSLKSIEHEWKFRNPFYKIKPTVDRYKGWRMSDPQISASVLLSLLHCKPTIESSTINRILGFIRDKQKAEGYWNAYWSNGRTLGTSSCIEALIKINGVDSNVEKAIAWLLSMQLDDGSWTNGVSNLNTTYDTALAVKALAADSSIHKSVLSNIKSGVHWLVNRQLPDGSWESSQLLRVPYQWDDTLLETPRILPVTDDKRRLFTTATILEPMTMYLRNM